MLTPQPQNRKHQKGISEKKRIAKGVRKFFEQNYELRYNVLKQTEEFRTKPRETNSNGCSGNSNERNEDSMPWNQLTDRELKKIAIEQMEFQNRCDSLVKRFDYTKAKNDALCIEMDDKRIRRGAVEQFLADLAKKDSLLTVVRGIRQWIL